MLRVLMLLAIIWAGVPGAAHATPAFGVYEGNGCSGAVQATAFTKWFGRAPDRMLDFIDFSSWGGFVGDAGWTAWCWKQNGAPPLTLSMPLTVKGTSLATVASGQMDSYFRSAAQAIVSNGYGAAIIRLGWEMNGGWYPWGGLNGQNWPAANGGAYVNSVQDYIAAYRHVVTLLRSVSSSFRFDWCPAGGNQQVGQATLYPGDDVVDIIGTDLYATGMVWGTANPSAAQVEAYFNQGWQFDWLSWFGHQHGKPISFPEWGIGDRPNGSNNLGPGDSPAVMAYVLAWFAAHSAPVGQPAGPGQIEYTNYWDFNAGDYNSKLSDGERPNEGLVLKQTLAIEPPDAVAITMTANPWKAPALANVFIDGVEVGSAVPVSANIWWKQTQTATYQVRAAAEHSVVVWFTNDAYGGSGSRDRNLYVVSIAVNGQAQAHSSANLYSNGSASFSTTGNPGH